MLAGVLPGPCTFQFHDPCRTGRSGWVAHRTAPLRNTDGAIIGVVKLVRDITERKQAEAALTASEHRYRRLFESAKDGILILDAETGMVMDVNPFLIDTLCISRNQFLSKKIWERAFQRYHRKPSQLRGAAEEQIHPLRRQAAPDRRRTPAGRGVRQQRLSGGWQEGDPVQHPRHHRAKEDRGGITRIAQDAAAGDQQYPPACLLEGPGPQLPGSQRRLARSGGLSNPADIIGRSDFELAWKDPPKRTGRMTGG